MGTDKRARQKELGRTRAEQARKEAEAAARRKRIVRLGTLMVVVLVIVVAALVLSSNDKKTSAHPTTTAEPGSAPAVLKGPGKGDTITGVTPCPAADGSSKRTTKFEQAPPMCINPKKTYVAKISTTKGDFSVALDTVNAPNTVNNFVVLSRYHFYDGIPFHRIVAGFMIQGGDPNDPPTGNGDPGYKFADELPKKPYEVGSIAMANSGPNTDGSQFFIVTGPQGVGLSPDYSLFGQVNEGLDVVSAIGATKSLKVPGNDGAPTEAVTINTVSIVES
jgi:cyclophilin family peptidyl-prolyl cis-trans isomerase